VGVLIDSSGSMAASRDLMIAAVTSFAENSNRQDEIFALSFNDDVNVVLPSDMPFTDDPETLRRALVAAIVPRGRTALYDGIEAGLAYLERGTRPRRVLVVISDGGDNASRATAEKIWQQTQGSNVLVYTVGVIDELETEANPKALKRLAEVTGGEAFRPRSVHDVDAVLRRIAIDIRHAYTIGYVPSNTDRDGKFHPVQVVVRPPGGQRVTVRTRTGYLAGDDGRRNQP
jgi:VWFA-related protein